MYCNLIKTPTEIETPLDFVILTYINIIISSNFPRLRRGGAVASICVLFHNISTDVIRFLRLVLYSQPRVWSPIPYG
jgi:hypothetical protein